LSYAADRQTDKQTDLNVLLTPTDRVSMGNKSGKTGVNASATQL